MPVNGVSALDWRERTVCYQPTKGVIRLKGAVVKLKVIRSIGSLPIWGTVLVKGFA